MKSRLFAAILIPSVLLGLVFFVFYRPDQYADPSTKVSLRNPIPPITTGQTPLFVAREKGFFADYGLEVKLEQGGAEVNPIKMVAAGKNTFGMVGGPEIVLVARGRGIPVKAIAILHRNANFPCFLTLKSSGITKLEQLEGKNVAFFTGHITTDVLKPLLKKNGVSVREFSEGLNYNQLVTGRFDAQWAFTVRAAIELPMRGVDVNVIRASDYGLKTHGYTIFALEKTINEKPELCEKLLRGIFDGIRFSLRNQDVAEQILVDINPTLRDKLDFVRKSEAMFNEVISNSEEHPMGYMDTSMFEDAYSYLKAEGAIENDFPLSDVYTTEFLETIHGQDFE